MFEELRVTMKKRGLSQNKLAMQANISPCDFSKAINGKLPFYPKWRRNIAEVLKVPEADLFDEEHENEN